MSLGLDGLDSSVAGEKFVIRALDIGCSGSISWRWERLIPNLIYFGIDPLVKEIERLQNLYRDFHFVDGFVSTKGCKGAADDGTVRFFSRSSAFADIQSGFDLIKRNFNHGQEVTYSEKTFSPEQLAAFFNVPSFDMIKIDVDGDDFSILKGFLDNSELEENLLAFEIESQFHGDGGEYGNTFDNIMRLSREKGFHLYKLDTYTYSRAAKPKPYVNDFPAQTYGGQVLWGDSVFIRDILEEDNRARILKLIQIYNIYDLDDCALEGINYHAKLLGLESSNLISSFEKDHLGARSNLRVLFRKLKRKLMSILG